MENKLSRFERKWVYRNNDYLTLVNALIRSNFFFRKQYPDRKVNSIYFDTPVFTDVWDNINGFGNRKKIRIRWYDEINQSAVFIEEKKKN